jgi:hypothetical protein
MYPIHAVLTPNVSTPVAANSIQQTYEENIAANRNQRMCKTLA